MYVDSAYIAKFYLNGPESPSVRRAMSKAHELVTSAWAIAEVAAAFHRKLREGSIDEALYRDLLDALRGHGDDGFWTFVPVTDRLLVKVVTAMRGLPAPVYLRAGDAIHLTTASDLGEREIWSNDRHLLAGASHFGLSGRSA